MKNVGTLNQSRKENSRGQNVKMAWWSLFHWLIFSVHARCLILLEMSCVVNALTLPGSSICFLKVSGCISLLDHLFILTLYPLFIFWWATTSLHKFPHARQLKQCSSVQDHGCFNQNADFFGFILINWKRVVISQAVIHQTEYTDHFMQTLNICISHI